MIHPPVGRIFPRPALNFDDAGHASFDALVGNGFALVGVNVSSQAVAGAARHPLWQKLNPTLISLSTDDRRFAPIERVHVCHLADPATNNALVEFDAQIVIVRPNRYVAGVAQPDGFDAISHAFDGLLR